MRLITSTCLHSRAAAKFCNPLKMGRVRGEIENCGDFQALLGETDGF